MSKFNKLLFIAILVVYCSMTLHAAEDFQVRLKDIASIQGIRENQLIGFGLVTGLDGRGDSSNSKLLQIVLSNLLAAFDLSIPANDIRSKNCAVVTVTSDIPSFARTGDRINIHLSSIGDARSLEGGILLQTNLQAANGSVYAVAQGKLSIVSTSERTKTVGMIPGGAIVEREVVSDFVRQNAISIVLRNPDFGTSNNIVEAVEAVFPDFTVSAIDSSLIQVVIPEEETRSIVAVISEIEDVLVTPDSDARIVVNARSGVVVFGKDARIGEVAVTFKGTNISVSSARRSRNDEQKNSFTTTGLTTVADLVQLLQTVGLTTDNIIEILKAIEQAGALYGRLIVM
jgi:flagellar P-ring protein FlgI